MYNANDRSIQDLLAAWEANDLKLSFKGNAELARSSAKHAHEGTKYLRLDRGSSGHLMVNRETGMVYSTKAYGVPNLKKPRGKVEFLTAFIKQCTEKNVGYTHHYWYLLHPIE
jgi:hypothetical protein